MSITTHGECDKCHRYTTLDEADAQKYQKYPTTCKQCVDDPNWRDKKRAEFWALFWNKFGIQTATYRELLIKEL